ncbi:hypothetical protein R9C00_15125 [Flammeovirgaceae bacterium SG7u.111]|nr:hypothetical protein [Flammeovirgaceae bacterium SG7u.132]WPO33034.1 hypothetical protein R9C00_15125 [Flammeovirgaceae bacterium SG7u.111]
MDNSIENTWKDGFLNDDAMIAPKINNLYTQKSKNIIDKLIKMFKLNFLFIIGLGLFFFAWSVFAGTIWVGLFMLLIFIGLAMYSKKQFDRMENIEKNLSTYQYLKAFDNWLQEAIASFTQIFRFFYPLIFISFMVGFRFSTYGEQVMEKLATKFPDLQLVWGFPLYPSLAVLFIALIIGIFAGPLYRLDLNLMYKNSFKKLKEIITDMEELRK